LFVNMHQARAADVTHALDALVDRIGRRVWASRLAALKRGCTNSYSGRALAQLHALELTVDRLRRPGRNTMPSVAEQRVATMATELLAVAGSLSDAGQARLDVKLREAMADEGTLVPLFHLVHTAALQRSRGFTVSYAGLEEGAPFDLLLSRDGLEAEIVCDVMSAEAGRDVHRGAWSALMDRVDPDLQDWLSAHPGRYLLKMTLPKGLKGGCTSDGVRLADLHQRITRLLSERRRVDHDEAALLRLDPLLLAAAQFEDDRGAAAGGKPPSPGLMPRLRQEFGPEAHLAVTATGQAVFVMAARAAREDEVADAVHRRMMDIAPVRLSGTRPGILAMFIEDTDRLEWRILRDQLRLEGAARHFLTRPEARSVVAVTCASREEMLGAQAADGTPPAELRFRNPGHPKAKAAALAAAVLSSP
jgi:hypothetical protein